MKLTIEVEVQQMFGEPELTEKIALRRIKSALQFDGGIEIVPTPIEGVTMTSPKYWTVQVVAESQDFAESYAVEKVKAVQPEAIAVDAQPLGNGTWLVEIENY